MRLAALFLATLIASSGMARAGDAKLNVISKVDAKDQGGSVVVTIEGSKPPSFTTFSMVDPPRFVIDLADGRFQNVPENIRVGGGTVLVVKSLSYGGEGTSIARILITFQSEVDPPGVSAEGNAVVVRIAKPGAAAMVASAAPSTPATTSAAASPPPVAVAAASPMAALAPASQAAAESKPAVNVGAVPESNRPSGTPEEHPQGKVAPGEEQVAQAPTEVPSDDAENEAAEGAPVRKAEEANAPAPAEKVSGGKALAQAEAHEQAAAATGTEPPTGEEGVPAPEKPGASEPAGAPKSAQAPDWPPVLAPQGTQSAEEMKPESKPASSQQAAAATGTERAPVASEKPGVSGPAEPPRAAPVPDWPPVLAAQGTQPAEEVKPESKPVSSQQAAAATGTERAPVPASEKPGLSESAEATKSAPVPDWPPVLIQGTQPAEEGKPESRPAAPQQKAGERSAEAAGPSTVAQVGGKAAASTDHPSMVEKQPKREEPERADREQVEVSEAPSFIREVGFKQLADSSRVFVRVSRIPHFTVVEAGERLIRVEFPHARVLRRNDTRTLDTSFFPGAVATIRSRRHGTTVFLEIQLKEKVAYRQHVEGDMVAIDFQGPVGLQSRAGSPVPPAAN